MPPGRDMLRLLVGFVAASIIVGFLLDTFAITPLDLWRNIWAAVDQAADFLWAQSGRLFGWLALGAVVVGPIMLGRWLLARLRRR